MSRESAGVVNAVSSAVAQWRVMLRDEVALLAMPGAHHKALLKQAHALHARTSHSYAFTWGRVRSQGAAPLSSDTGVNSVDCHELGRAANVARIIVGMPLDTDPLPPLLDATLAGLAVTGFVLSGIEYVDGCAYAQSWWCREG